MTKKCSICNQEKSLEDFGKSSRNKSGKRADCKECNRASNRKWYRENPDKVLFKRHKEKQKYQERIKFRRLNEPDFRKRARERSKKYYYDPKNKEKIRLRNRLIMRNKLKNPYYRIVFNLRRRIPAVIKENVKSAPTFKLLGCDKNQLISYLKSKFQPGMSWDNYGRGQDKWVIDHILPCASFDLSKPEEQRKCFHYTNLQPLWYFDNLAKSDTVPNHVSIISN